MGQARAAPPTEYWPWRNPATRTAGVAALVLGAGLAREIVLARAFGLSNELDVFLVVASVPLAAMAVFSGTFQSAAVPVITQVLQTPRDSGDGYHVVVGRYAIALAGLTAVWLGIARLAPQALTIFAAPGALNAVMLALTVVLGAIVAGVSAFALAVGRSATVAFAPAAVPLTTATIVLATQHRTSTVLFAGLLLGNALAMAALLGVLRSAGTAMSDLRLPRWSRYKLWRQGTLIASGTIVMAMTAPVDLYFAGTLATGAAAALSFGGKVPLAWIGVGGVVISNVAFPALSRHAVNRDYVAIRSALRRWTAVGLFAGIISLSLILLASDLLVAVLFAGGEMQTSDLQSISNVQRLFALSLPTFWMGLIWTKALIALEETPTLAWIGLVAFIVNGVGNHFLSDALGVMGVALATSLMYLITTSIAGLRLRRVLPRRLEEWRSPRPFEATEADET